MIGSVKKRCKGSQSSHHHKRHHEESPLLSAFLEHRVSASVVDLDHYRIHGGMAVETDYIIRVQPILEVIPKGNEPEFEGFLLSKTYSAFRTFAHQLKKAADLVIDNYENQKSKKKLPKKVQKLAQYAETVVHLVEAQRIQYLGKVNYNYVKVLSKKRSQIINETLEATLSYFPDEIDSHPFLAEIAHTIETFFLFDHCQEADDSSSENSILSESGFDTLATTTNTKNSNDTISTGASTNNGQHNKSLPNIIFKTPTKKVGVDRYTSASTTKKMRSMSPPPNHHQGPSSAIRSSAGGGIPFKLDEAAEKLQSFLKSTFSGDETDNTATTVSRNTVPNINTACYDDDYYDDNNRNNSIIDYDDDDDSPPHTSSKPPFLLGIDTCLTNAVTASKRKNSATTLVSPVVPYTRKMRRSVAHRALDEDELNEVGMEANLLLDDERPPTELVPSYARPVPNFSSRGTKVGDLLENNPTIFVCIFVASVAFLRHVTQFTITMDLDIQLLLLFASFCIGLHTPRPMIGGIDKAAAGGQYVPPTPIERNISNGGRVGVVPPGSSNRGKFLFGSNAPIDNNSQRSENKSVRLLLRRSMVTSPDAQSDAVTSKMDFSDVGGIVEEEEEEFLDMHLQSPLPKFPDGAELGSQLNCWSQPVASRFNIRGPNYLTDKKKIPSGQFVFPVRGVDLFLTDTCPENAGSIGGVFGGDLREAPTFIINFRLPWGILLAYFEIPERFLPFLRAGYEPEFDKSTLPSLDDMSPSDRCVARWLQGTDAHKNKTLKIVPMVVEGPWVVKSVVGGKPAIIGNKLPVTYCYQRAEKGPEGTPHSKSQDKACYLEADLDIVASSAARGILSVARTYTQVLTIDLGFVVQGDSDDELPEQMLVGARLHGIDPHSAPELPLSKDMFSMDFDENDDDDESTT